jgi:hypothetical protein
MHCSSSRLESQILHRVQVVCAKRDPCADVVLSVLCCVHCSAELSLSFSQSGLQRLIGLLLLSSEVLLAPGQFVEESPVLLCM